MTRDWPLRRKFLVGTLAITLPAIALVSIFLIVTEFRSVRATRLANTRAFVGMIAKNAAAALIFDDAKVAQQILSGITANPSAEVAALYDQQGKLYARFPTNLPLSSVPDRGQPAGLNYTATRLEIFADVVNEVGHHAGTAYVRVNLNDMRQRFFVYVSTVVFISIVAALLVLVLSRLIERWTVTPLLELSRTAETIAAQGDYSLRAHKQGADEVGALVDAFNQMLEETQHSQAALQASEARKAAILKSALDAIITIDHEDKLLEFNPAAEKIFGYTRDAVLGRRMAELIVPERFRARHYRGLAHYLATGEGPVLQKLIEMPATRASGQEFPCELAIVPIPGSTPPSFTAFVRDITERKLVAEALRESEEQFRSMANNILPLAWMANADGGIFFYNQRWFDYTGTTFDEMQGWGWEKVHHPDHIKRVVEKWREHLRRGETWEDTFPLRGRDGQYRWFLSRAFPLRNAQGEITRWFGTNTDVTELRETQEALERAGAKLRQHSAELETTVAERTAALRETVGELEAFSYSIAHDMRAPLRSMTGYSSILSSDYSEKLDEEGRDFLRRIANSAERLDRLIQDVLNYSKVVRGELKLESIDTAKLIHEIVDSYPNLHPPHAEIIIQEPLPSVRVNPAAFTQIISNLLGNAAKFVAQGVKPRIVVRAETFADHVRLWFEDNGIGIELEAQKRLFQIFQRIHRPDLYEGTGIGLAIVRKAAERMGGRVGVESEPDKGSRFWVELQKG